MSVDDVQKSIPYSLNFHTGSLYYSDITKVNQIMDSTGALKEKICHGIGPSRKRDMARVLFYLGYLPPLMVMGDERRFTFKLMAPITLDSNDGMAFILRYFALESFFYVNGKMINLHKVDVISKLLTNAINMHNNRIGGKMTKLNVLLMQQNLLPQILQTLRELLVWIYQTDMIFAGE